MLVQLNIKHNVKSYTLLDILPNLNTRILRPFRIEIEMLIHVKLTRQMYFIN